MNTLSHPVMDSRDPDPPRARLRLAWSATGGGAATPQPLRSAGSCGLSSRFHAWKGRSGSRYVVSVYARRALPDFADAVLLAVRRAPDGRLTLLGVRATDEGLANWPELAEADEVHVHLLAQGAQQRRRAVADLTEG